MSDHYILDGHTPVPCDLMTWARMFEKSDRRVARTEKDGVKVSTVFLGLNHQYGDGPPLLFETMIFGGKRDEYQDRCSTWEEAEKMHAAACELAFGVNAEREPHEPRTEEDKREDDRDRQRAYPERGLEGGK